MFITDAKQLEKFSAPYRVWQGIPGFARTPGGRTFVSFYSGNVKETYGNYALIIKSDDGKLFGEPVAVAKKEGKFRCFDPVLWVDPLGRLWFIWNVMPGEEVWGVICEDPDAEELRWSEEFYIGRGVMMNKPTVLTTGEWLFPIALWKLDIFPEIRKVALKQDDVSGTYVYKTSDNGKTFIKLGMADIAYRTFDEHMVVEMENGVLRMLVRTVYGIANAYSYDRGKTWSKGGSTTLGGPDSRFFIRKLRSGRVLLVNHYHYTKRNNLTAMLSEDDGKTFPYTLLLDERIQVSYPDGVEDEDGFIHIVYDRERGCGLTSLEAAQTSAREILTAKITEQDILSGKLVTEGSYLKNVVCKLGKLSEDMQDPYQPTQTDREIAEELLSGEADDIRTRIFEMFPRNCVSSLHFDEKKLNGMVDKFEKNGGQDVEQLAEIIGFIRCTPIKNVQREPVVEKVKKYIDEHIGEDFSMAALAEEVNISVYYMAHLFKAVTGTTVMEYRNEKRITIAKSLLITTDLSIGDIAQKVGYNPAYFSEIFVKAERISPSQYRKYHKL